MFIITFIIYYYVFWTNFWCIFKVAQLLIGITLGFHETVLLVLNNRGRDALLILLATSLMTAGDLRSGQV